jgi:hypothetical protein
MVDNGGLSSRVSILMRGANGISIFGSRTENYPLRWLHSAHYLLPPCGTPTKKDEGPPLLQAIQDSRKGQAELSAVLGERVRRSS